MDRTLRSVAALSEAQLVAPGAVPELERVARRFSVALTPYLVQRLRIDGPSSPLARQFLPHADELTVLAGERPDPIGDQPMSPVPGVVHRYPDRVLLKPVHVCPAYCRFCFRREVVGSDGQVLTPAQLDAALAYIQAHPEIWEVILTGGDPLVLSADRLGRLVDRIAAIPHVQVLRVHTRLPFMDPERLTPGRIQALGRMCPTWVVVHVNHPDELTDLATAALARLADAGIPLLAQTVLLRGINDQASVLECLFRGLVKRRVKPYYLHHGDLAQGTSHFRTTLDEGRDLVRTLRGRLSGIAQPTYVLDIPGGHGKVPAGAPWVHPLTHGGWRVDAPDGGAHAYPPVRG